MNKDKSTPSDMPRAGVYTLPDGTVISLADWINESLRSAFIIDPQRPCKEWELFTYGRGQPCPGTDIISRAHTNVPRSGDSGLPRDWEMHVRQWRAVVSAPLGQPILDWAAETTVQFEYNAKFYGNTTMLDLLLGTRPVGDPLPVHLRENLGFRVRVLSDERATAALATHLRSDDIVADNVRDAVTELDAILRLQPDGPLAANIRHVQAKLRPNRQLTVWVHLEGPLKRVVL